MGKEEWDPLRDGRLFKGGNRAPWKDGRYHFRSNCSENEKKSSRYGKRNEAPSNKGKGGIMKRYWLKREPVVQVGREKKKEEKRDLGA